MNVSSAGLDLIKRHEGLRLEAYLCPAGVWTIGFGHTSGVCEGQSISEGMAEEFLDEDVAKAEACVRSAVALAISQPQFDALCSFALNLGCGNLRRSTLLRMLNRGDFRGAAKEFDRWVYGGGVPLPGLITRRAEERALFESGIVDNGMAFA